MVTEAPLPRVVRLIDSLSELSGRIAVLLVVPLVLVCAGNATMRYTLNYSSNGWLEIQWYLFSGIFLLGASYALKHNAHVRIDLLFNRFSPRAQAAVDLATLGLFLLPFAGLMVWLGWPFFHTAFVTGETSSNVGGLVRWPAKALVPLGMLLLFLQGVAEIVKRLVLLMNSVPAVADESGVAASSKDQDHA